MAVKRKHGQSRVKFVAHLLKFTNCCFNLQVVFLLSQLLHCQSARTFSNGSRYRGHQTGKTRLVLRIEVGYEEIFL